MTAKKTKTVRKYDTVASLRKEIDEMKAQMASQASLQPQGEPQISQVTQDPVITPEFVEEPYKEPEQETPVIQVSEVSSPKKILGMSVNLFNILLAVFVVIGLVAFIAFRYDNVKRDKAEEKRLEQAKDSVSNAGRILVEQLGKIEDEKQKLEQDGEEKRAKGEKVTKEAANKAKELDVLSKYLQEQIKQNNETTDSLNIGDLQSGVNEEY